MATLKKRIQSYYGQQLNPIRVRMNGIAHVLYWRGERAKVSASKLDNISLEQLSGNYNRGDDNMTGRLEFPIVRDHHGHPIAYNDTFLLFLAAKEIIFVLVSTYLDSNE